MTTAVLEDVVAGDGAPGMRCPSCRSADTRVIDSRPSAVYIRRRRRCQVCTFKFSTREITVSENISPQAFEFLMLLAARLDEQPTPRRRLTWQLIESLLETDK